MASDETAVCERCQMPKAASLQDYLDHGFYLESGEPANSLCGDHLSGSPYAHVHCRDVTITRLSTDLTRVKAELAEAEGRVANLRLGLELVTRSIVPGRVARRALERDDALTSATDGAGRGGTGT